MATMNWSKAGRPKKKNVVVGTATASDLMQAGLSENDYDESELTLYNYGYVALALAVIKQGKKDNVNVNSIPSMYTDYINCYVEEFTKKLCPVYSIGKDEEDSNG